MRNKIKFSKYHYTLIIISNSLYEAKFNSKNIRKMLKLLTTKKQLINRFI